MPFYRIKLIYFVKKNIFAQNYLQSSSSIIDPSELCLDIPFIKAKFQKLKFNSREKGLLWRICQRLAAIDHFNGLASLATLGLESICLGHFRIPNESREWALVLETALPLPQELLSNQTAGLLFFKSTLS
mgnify:CR=1 FL=1